MGVQKKKRGKLAEFGKRCAKQMLALLLVTVPTQYKTCYLHVIRYGKRCGDDFKYTGVLLG